MKKSLTTRVKEWYQNLKGRMVLKVAIEKADMLHKMHGVRYWVVPTPEGSLLVLNWRECLEYRYMGIFPKRLTVQALYSIAFYWSDSKRGGNKGFQHRKDEINMTKYIMWWWGTKKRRGGRR